jgi:hypothetical protein
MGMPLSGAPEPGRIVRTFELFRRDSRQTGAS